MNLKRQSQSTSYIPSNDEVYGNYQASKPLNHKRRLSTIVSNTPQKQIQSQVNLKYQSIQNSPERAKIN